MTSFHLDDETLSASIDGEATGPEQDHLAACPACQQRAEAFRAVARAVGGPVTARPPADVDRAVEAAVESLALASEPAAGVGVGVGVGFGSAAPVESLESARARRNRRNPRILAVAAALVLIVGGAGLVAVLSRGSSPPKSMTASRVAPPTDSADSAAGTAAKGSASPAAPGGGAATAQAPSPALRGIEADLGPQADPVAVAGIVNGQIRAGAASQLAAGAPSGATAEAPTQPPCLDQGRAASGLAGQQAPLRYAASLRWRGQDAVVLVYDRPAGGRSGVVMAKSNCVLLSSLPV